MKRPLELKKLIIALSATAILAILLLFVFLRNQPQSIDLALYQNLLKTGSIQKALIQKDEILLDSYGQRYTIIKDGISLNELLKEVPIEVEKEYPILQEFMFILVLILVLVFLFIFSKKQRENEIRKQNQESKKQAFEIENLVSSTITPAISGLSFKDVAGIKDVKEELSEIVDFLKFPSKYKHYGIKLPRGVLMVGPPGVGKTMVAKAVAGEANVPFFYQSGASFVQIYVGMGAKRVRELFSKAKAYAPSIIFIDEIDAVGKARGGLRNDEREATLNQLLTEMDGFEDNSGVIVIAATNRMEMCDEALLRSGRFDRRIFLSLPDFKDRIEILKTYIKNKPISESVRLEEIAKMSVGFSGAALNTFVNEAAINALRRKSELIEIDDFINVREKVLLGKRKVLSFSEEEKQIQALYQASKALCAYWFEVDFDKITILSDRLKETDKEIESKSRLLAKIKVHLAGMVALKMHYKESFSNASNDLNRAREIAQTMVQEYGMGESLVPTQNDISSILKEALEDVQKFLEGMKEPLKLISQKLIEEESISKSELKEAISEFWD